MAKLKKIILTADYELFLGKQVGKVENCMITPTELLINLLDKYNCKMTVFWDILHYWKLLQLENEYHELKQDIKKIEKQIISLVKKKYDVQLHLHPQWIDANYDRGIWNFTYDKYKLQNLSKRNDLKDINTIIGCVTISRKLMESVCRKAEPNYKVYALRAGGYCIQPFEILLSPLYNNGIYVDSSCCYGLKNSNKYFSYDFTNVPKESCYKFDSDLNKPDKMGKFIEIQIESVKISSLLRLWFAFLRRLKYRKLGRIGDGAGIQSKNSKRKLLQKLFKIFFYTDYAMLTSDNNFKEKYNYLIRKSNNESVQIIHPKYLNEHILEVFEDSLMKKKISFISIQNFLEKNHIE